MTIVTGGPEAGTTIQIADIIDTAGIKPSDGQEEVPVPGDTAADIQPATTAGTTGGVHRLFKSDDEDSDAHLGEQVEALLAEGGPLEV